MECVLFALDLNYLVARSTSFEMPLEFMGMINDFDELLQITISMGAWKITYHQLFMV